MGLLAHGILEMNYLTPRVLLHFSSFHTAEAKAIVKGRVNIICTVHTYFHLNCDF